jgi:hypothetical protein
VQYIRDKNDEDEMISTLQKASQMLMDAADTIGSSPAVSIPLVQNKRKYEEAFDRIKNILAEKTKDDAEECDQDLYLRADGSVGSLDNGRQR